MKIVQLITPRSKYGEFDQFIMDLSDIINRELKSTTDDIELRLTLHELIRYKFPYRVKVRSIPTSNQKTDVLKHAIGDDNFDHMEKLFKDYAPKQTSMSRYTNAIAQYWLTNYGGRKSFPDVAYFVKGRWSHPELEPTKELLRKNGVTVLDENFNKVLTTHDVNQQLSRAFEQIMTAVEEANKKRKNETNA